MNAIVFAVICALTPNPATKVPEFACHAEQASGPMPVELCTHQADDIGRAWYEAHRPSDETGMSRAVDSECVIIGDKEL